MEEEVREILKVALASAAREPRDLAEAMHAPFAAIGGVELPRIPRERMREPPTFE